MAPTNGVFGHLILILAIVGALTLFGERVWRLVRLVRVGTAEDRFDDMPGRVRDLLLYVLGQRRLIKSPNRVPGIIHALIFW
ncbi:MAG TPA: electron transfer flavoprotein, partial [Chloroflexota bacterium]|nr:electron transfer flavoprotein [Chloroflexota bacterium]